MQTNNTSTLEGNIISVEDDGKQILNTILLSNRLIKVKSAQQDVNFKVGDKVEVVYNNAVPVIRKL